MVQEQQGCLGCFTSQVCRASVYWKLLSYLHVYIHSNLISFITGTSNDLKCTNIKLFTSFDSLIISSKFLDLWTVSMTPQVFILLYKTQPGLMIQMLKNYWTLWASFCQQLSLFKYRKDLDTDHYGLDKLKKRVIEYLAVRQLKNSLKGPILCFVGPPGVGKTSVGKSIAQTLGREFHRSDYSLKNNVLVIVERL